MTAKLLVLYPQPLDPSAFETYYHAQHMPLMREHVIPGVALPTYRILPVADETPAFYRCAEIPFASLEELQAFVRSERARTGSESAIRVSTGGRPVLLLCAADPDV
jgi:uncharacterized protein (TIGR02118 family)